MNKRSIVLLSTGSLYHMGIDHIFDIAHQSGFEYIELMLRSRKESCWWDFWSAKRLQQLENNYKLKIESLHSPIDFEMDAAGYIDSTIALGQRLKVRHIIFHIPKNKDKYEEYRLWFANKYNSYLKSSAVTLLTENMGPRCIEQGAEQYNKYPDFCFDIAHELSNGSDIAAVVSKMPNIRQFHVSWFDGKECHMEIMKHKTFFKEVLSLHPTASRCLELRPEAFTDPFDDEKIINALTQARKLLESI